MLTNQKVIDAIGSEVRGQKTEIRRQWTASRLRETDLATRRFGWRREERQEFLVDVAQNGVMLQQCSIDLGQTLQDRGICCNFFAQLNECANDVNAHRNCSFTSQDVRHLERAMLSECPRSVNFSSMLSGTGRNLRPVTPLCSRSLQ